MQENFKPDWVSPPGDSIQNIIKAIGLTLHEVQLLLTGKIRIDKYLAEKLSIALGSTKDFWLRRDQNYVSECKRLKKGYGYERD